MSSPLRVPAARRARRPRRRRVRGPLSSGTIGYFGARSALAHAIPVARSVHIVQGLYQPFLFQRYQWTPILIQAGTRNSVMAPKRAVNTGTGGGRDRTFALALFDELASLERWGKGHKTYLRLFHEVLVLELEQQVLEYVNQSPRSSRGTPITGPRT
ncbi:hypothetical protein CSUB01_07508 [Colletotrichum sublineola]|uniref:Uncharacterized protein n=1 Tax=Colletotrichum sublineola TaxID=1173701 RepID=A0A066XLT3_COLSU|nr:hypothetical protein CSUB01_07508 [Colletotrichum sublineola]